MTALSARHSEIEAAECTFTPAINAQSRAEPTTPSKAVHDRLTDAGVARNARLVRAKAAREKEQLVGVTFMPTLLKRTVARVGTGSGGVKGLVPSAPTTPSRDGGARGVAVFASGVHGSFGPPSPPSRPSGGRTVGGLTLLQYDEALAEVARPDWSPRRSSGSLPLDWEDLPLSTRDAVVGQHSAPAPAYAPTASGWEPPAPRPAAKLAAAAAGKAFPHIHGAAAAADNRLSADVLAALARDFEAQLGRALSMAVGNELRVGDGVPTDERVAIVVSHVRAALTAGAPSVHSSGAAGRTAWTALLAAVKGEGEGELGEEARARLAARDEDAHTRALGARLKTLGRASASLALGHS
jgi:hypothetical protein